MARIITDDRRDNVVIKERDKDVETEPVRSPSRINLGNLILAIFLIMLALLLIRGLF